LLNASKSFFEDIKTAKSNKDLTRIKNLLRATIDTYRAETGISTDHSPLNSLQRYAVLKYFTRLVSKQPDAEAHIKTINHLTGNKKELKHSILMQEWSHQNKLHIAAMQQLAAQMTVAAEAVEVEVTTTPPMTA